jgi:hypothetical protein
MEKLIEQVNSHIENIRKEVNAELDSVRAYVDKQIVPQKQEGIVIDHKTFSEIINTLSVCGCQGDATKVLANKLIEIGKAQTGKAEKNESEVVNEAIQELLKNFRVVAPKVEPKQEKVEQKPTNCDFNCQECKESHAEAMRKRINEDPILSLLDIVRMAAATGKR